MRILQRDQRNGVRPGARTQSLGAKTPASISRADFCHAADERHHSGLSPTAIAYLRVSTEEQAESGLGLDAQRASVTAAAARLGVTLQAVHVDAGLSGSLSIERRPGLLQAVSTLRRGGLLLVAKRDRLGRDFLEVAVIEQLVEKRRARVVSAAGEGTENDDPSSWLLRRMIDIFAQFERLIGRARTKAGLAVKRARGERIGEVPYGSQLAADGIHLEPAPVEQRLVAHIRALQGQGLSTRAIAAALNRDGVTTRKGTAWRFEYIARILRNGRTS